MDVQTFGPESFLISPYLADNASLFAKEEADLTHELKS